MSTLLAWIGALFLSVNYKILYRHFVIALCRETNVLFAFNTDRKLVAGLLQDWE